MNLLILGQAHFDFKNRHDKLDEFIYILLKSGGETWGFHESLS
jgi:hypothetical protein